MHLVTAIQMKLQLKGSRAGHKMKALAYPIRKKGPGRPDETKTRFPDTDEDIHITMVPGHQDMAQYKLPSFCS